MDHGNRRDSNIAAEEILVLGAISQVSARMARRLAALAKQLLHRYQRVCAQYGDFYFALESAGFERVVLNRKRYFKGLRIRTEDDAVDDFLK